MTVTCRIFGGVTREAGDGVALTLESLDRGTLAQDRGAGPGPRRREVEGEEVRALLDVIGAGIGGMIPRSEASFLPDSHLASVRIEIGDRQAEWFALTDATDRLVQGKPVPRETEEAISRIRRLADAMRGERGEST